MQRKINNEKTETKIDIIHIRQSYVMYSLT